MDKDNDHDKYNGWTNFETWTVSLWIDNEESSFRYWREQSKHHRDCAPTSHQVASETWTVAEAAKFNLADQLQAEITEGVPLQYPSIYNDLLTAALSEVNWTEIAHSWLAEEAS